MYKNEVKKVSKFKHILITLFGSYGFRIVYGPDKEGEFEYEHYYTLFGTVTSLGSEYMTKE